MPGGTYDGVGLRDGLQDIWGLAAIQSNIMYPLLLTIALFAPQ